MRKIVLKRGFQNYLARPPICIINLIILKINVIVLKVSFYLTEIFVKALLLIKFRQNDKVSNGCLLLGEQ